MLPRRNFARFGAVLAASFLLALAAGAQPSKLDARLRARRGASSGGFAPAGAGGGAPAGPERPLMLRVVPGTTVEALRAAYPAARFGSEKAGVVTARADDATIDAIAADARVLRVEHAVMTRPSMDLVRSTHQWSGVPGGTVYGASVADLVNATGAGVVVGVVDSGIDWQHLDFINDGPNTSRILYLWDQTIASHADGPNPSGFAYGAEYTNAQITAKIQGGANDINTVDSLGHGTHVASIAAGDGTATNGAIPSGTYRGIAPSADIIAVKTSFNTNDVIDGVNYIIARAAALGKRAVINLSLGTAYGPHDGTSSFETPLGVIAASTPVVVAMGNDGGAGGHASLTMPTSGSNSVTINRVGSTTDADIEFWIPNGDGYTVTVTLNGAGGSVSSVDGVDASGTLNGHTVDLYNGSNTGHPLNHKQIYVYINRGAGITATSFNVAFTRTSNGSTGRIDGWLDPAQNIAYATFVDATGTLGEPAAANNVFGVASYASKKDWLATDNNFYFFTSQATLGSVSLFSGAGPTRDGRQQPDVAAPGDVIIAALSSNGAAYPGDVLVAPDDRHRINRGTSMAAPVVAGILAARIQWGPGRTVSDLRAILRAQARTDSATGSVPNNDYGYGKAASSPQPSASPTGLSATTLGTASITWNWSTVVGADYYHLFYATNPAVIRVSSVTPPYTLTNLPANTTTGVLIKGVGAGIAGPGAFISTGTYAPPPSSLPALTPHVSSVTASYTACPAAPAASSCFGYVLTASTAPNFSGALFSASTNNRATTSLVVTGLAPVTLYYFRLATLNALGAQTSTTTATATTLTDLVAPTSPAFTNVTATSQRLDWNPSTNPGGVTWNAQASTAPNFSGTLLTNSATPYYAIFTGMTPNASYYFRVQAVGGPFMLAGPNPTLAQAPSAAAQTFFGVSQTSFSVQWSSAPNTTDTIYDAEISAAADFSTIAGSSRVRQGYAAFGGLTSNSIYYARARAVSHAGIATSYTTLGSTPTLVQDPGLPAQPISGQSSDGFSFTWTSGGNAPGTLYLARLSTGPAFATLTATVLTSGLTASWSGLDSNRLYYAQVAALNLGGTSTAFTAAASTQTKVIEPVNAAITGQDEVSIDVTWAAGRLGPGTDYWVEASEDPGFAAAASIVVGPATAVTLGALNPNTVHYLRVRAVSANPPTPDGPWLFIGQRATLANAPTAAATPFPLVGVASMTIAWTPLPLAPQSAGAQGGYIAELSQNAAFTTVLRSSSVAPGAGTASFFGLSFGTQYWTRVGSVNPDGTANYMVVGTTITTIPTLASGTVAGGTLSLVLPPTFAQTPGVRADVEPGTFPNGTAVVMLAGVQQDLTNPPSKVARLTAVAPSLGVEISAGGMQPLKPVRLTFTYDPLQLAPGSDVRRLVVGRFDEASGFWTLMPSGVDRGANTVTATLDHFSAFSPFFATAGASVGDGLVFPQPWEIGEGGGEFGAQRLTFANYPAQTRIRLLTLTGELVWEGETGANGVLTWDGRNKHGRDAASGTYYAVIESQGARKVRRVAIVR